MASRKRDSVGPFKTTADGSRLFLPWGRLGPAYLIPCDDARERLQSRHHKTVQRGSMVAVFLGLLGANMLEAMAGCTSLLGQVMTIVGISLAVFCAYYLVWIRFQCHHFHLERL